MHRHQGGLFTLALSVKRKDFAIWRMQYQLRICAQHSGSYLVCKIGKPSCVRAVNQTIFKITNLPLHIDIYHRGNIVREATVISCDSADTKSIVELKNC